MEIRAGPVGAVSLWMVCAGAEMVSDQARLGVVCGLSPEGLPDPHSGSGPITDFAGR